MLKTKVKIIITLTVIFIAMCLLNVSKVQAVEITENELQEILDLIPDTMELDIPEVEYEKVDELIIANVKSILDDKSIQYEDVEYGIKLKDVTINGYGIKITTYGASIYYTDALYQSHIYIEATNGNTSYSNYNKSKMLEIVYNNTDEYNSEDAAYIKNLILESPKYYEVDLDFLVPDGDNYNNVWREYFEIIEEYYTNLIKDSSIVVSAEIVAGGRGGELNLWTSEDGTCIGIFKNGVLYENRIMGQECTVPVITVPNTVAEDEINDYVISQITTYYKEFGGNITSIVEGSKDVLGIDITNGYTIYSDYGKESCIIIKRELTEEKLQEIIDAVIPDTMNLDIPEIEHKKAEELVLTNIKRKLDEQNIQYEEVDSNYKAIKAIIEEKEVTFNISYASMLFHEKIDFHTAYIYVNVNNSNISTKSKTIQLVYNNKDKYNSKDEKYIKNLQLDMPKYFELPFDEFWGSSKWNEIIKKYIDKKIKDDSIVFEVSCDGGGGYLNGGMIPQVAIFKDGILYDWRIFDNAMLIPSINVPNAIKEDEIENYVMNEIKTKTTVGPYINSVSKDIKSSLSYLENKEIYDKFQNLYTMTWNDRVTDYVIEYIIVKQEKQVTSKDKKTNIKIETLNNIVPEDTKLVVEEIKEEKTKHTIKEALKEISNKYVVFDISLISKEEKIQPNGKVKISIPVPDGFDESKLIVYRIEADGTKIKFDVEVVDIEGVKHARFETDHFSSYVLAEKTIENTEQVLDDQPKTGILDIKLIIGIILVISIILIVKNKKSL